MSFQKFQKSIKFLASLKLAVFVILSIVVISAVGTIIESKYDAFAAKKLVYDTFWMYLIMSLLTINLTAVIVERFPWKKRHAAFILAHIGIIILLFGSWLTSKYGIDGSMYIEIGKESKYVSLPETELSVYSSFDGMQYTKLYASEVDFFTHPPTLESPIEIPMDSGSLKVIDYKKYVLPNRVIEGTENQNHGSAVRFQIHNDRVNVVEWLVQKTKQEPIGMNFGPASISLGIIPAQSKGGNEIYLSSSGDQVEYALFRKESSSAFKKGKLSEGNELDTGWMGLKLKILRYHPYAIEKFDIKERPYPTPLTTSAIKVRYKNEDNWIIQNDVYKFFSEKAVFVLSYGQKKMDIGFPIFLKEFVKDNYQGTQKAMSYKSHVRLPDASEYEISMNEPLKKNGLTFYQASFQENETGQIQASILSVNYDPGRWLKYLGSFIISLGTILLFYFKRLEFKFKRKE